MNGIIKNTVQDVVRSIKYVGMMQQLELPTFQTSYRFKVPTVAKLRQVPSYCSFKFPTGAKFLHFTAATGTKFLQVRTHQVMLG
jgi:hypothetical protein